MTPCEAPCPHFPQIADTEIKVKSPATSALISRNSTGRLPGLSVLTLSHKKLYLEKHLSVSHEQQALMDLRNSIKKIWFSLYNSGRVVLLDHPVFPAPLDPANPHGPLFDLINANRENYCQVLKNTLDYKEVFSGIKEDKMIKNDTDPGWNNGYLPGLDIIMLYSLLNQVKPSKYVEIGSGTSTKIAHKAKKENSLNYEIISIDPLPRKNISKVADKIYQQNIQDVTSQITQRLEKDDVLFFDGTHILYPNSDVLWFFLEILPNLKKGVIVHFHDIYLPYDYPDFMLKRYYNEQYVLGALLLNNPAKYEIISPNYFIYSDKTLHQLLDPIWKLGALENVEQHGGSFWMRVR